MNPQTFKMQNARPAVPASAILPPEPAPAGDGGCERLLEHCARLASAAHGQLHDCPNELHELSATLAECSLLCETALRAMALQARTERDLRLICAAVCHLTADLCNARRDDWAAPLAATASACAEACRQLPLRHWRRSAAAA